MKANADYKQERPQEEKHYRTFEDLKAYQIAREFRKMMYGVNRRLPAFEKFELGSQIRRAAVSLTNNIVEGHGRFHYLEQLKFCLNARGSLEELNVCHDESYLPAAEIALLKEQGWRVHKVLSGYMRWLRNQKQTTKLKVHENSSAYSRTEDDLGELLEQATVERASTL